MALARRPTCARCFAGAVCPLPRWERDPSLNANEPVSIGPNALPLPVMARSLLDWLLILLALVIYVAGLQLNIMDVDSAQYASISQEMEQSGSYLEVKNKGQDYLDKPPLLFWTSALSFKLFGFHNWSFKLIPFLLALASIRATHRLGRLLVDEQVGRWAAVMLGCLPGLFPFHTGPAHRHHAHRMHCHCHRPDHGIQHWGRTPLPAYFRILVRGPGHARKGTHRPHDPHDRHRRPNSSSTGNGKRSSSGTGCSDFW